MSTATDPAVDLPAIELLFSVSEVAAALSRSERWLKNQIKERGLEHTRFGNRIKFTRRQFDALVATYIVTVNPPPVTTGRQRT